jgi:ribosomal protein L20A (L18A)
MAKTSSKLKAMEREYLFKVYYGLEFVKLVTARSRWEAVELVYSRLVLDYPELIRSKIRVKKV